MGGKSITVKSIQEIGDLVREQRKKLALKQMEAAGLLGVGVRFLSELERGKETLEVGKVIKVLMGLGLSLSLEIKHEPKK